MQQTKTIKIFLGSSITELHDERLILSDYLMNSVRPIFKQDGIEVEVLKCEDIRSGNTGRPPQNKIDTVLRGCNVSVFMFKCKTGDMTVHEFDVARKLQKRKRHEIYVYCFKVQGADKSQELKDFQKRLIEELFYWYDCKDVADLESQFVLGLLKLERQLLEIKGKSTLEQETASEKDGDTLFKELELNKQALHIKIDELLQQAKNVMAIEEGTIAEKIFKVIELYKKADRWAAATDYDKEKYSNLLFEYAKFLYDYGLYWDAEAVCLRHINLVEGLFGKEHEKTAIAYNKIGLVYWHQGNYKEALDYLFKTLTIREKVLGTIHPDIATSYNNIGSVYWKQGNYDKALVYRLKALTIREKILGTEHPDIGTSYNDIGIVYNDQGDYSKALEYYFKALAIAEKSLGTEHPDTARSYNNIGTAYDDQGDYDMALKYHLKALTIKEKVLGTEHPSTATSYNNIGKVYRKKGDYDKALEYHLKDLAICEKVLGTIHPDTATSYNNVGWVYRNQGDYKTALDYYTKAYRILKEKFGEEHLSTKEVLESIEEVKKAIGLNT